MRLAPAEIYKHILSFISCDLIKTTLIVLRELISVRDGAFCLDQFHDDLVISMIDCICRLWFIVRKFSVLFFCNIFTISYISTWLFRLNQGCPISTVISSNLQSCTFC